MTEKVYKRLDLAKWQLDTALDLFLDQKNYPSAITLAGAAEEIFGRAITFNGGKSALDKSYESIAEFHAMLHGAELNKKAYINKENYARNALKHLQHDKEPTIAIDLEETACWMLVRALQNGKKLDLEFVRFQDFNNWFYKNIIGM